MTTPGHNPPFPAADWTCERVRDELEAWALDALEPADMTAVEHHIAWCEVCRHAADRLTRTAGLLPFALDPVSPSTGAKHALMTRIADDQMQAATSYPQWPSSDAPRDTSALPQPRHPRHWSQLLIAPLAITLLVMTLWSFDLRSRVDDADTTGLVATGTTTAMLPAGVRTFTLHSDCEQCQSAGKLLADPKKADALMVAWNLDPSEIHQVWCVEDDGSKVLVASLDVSPAGDVVQPLLFDQPISGYSQIYVMSLDEDDKALKLGMVQGSGSSPVPDPASTR